MDAPPPPDDDDDADDGRGIVAVGGVIPRGGSSGGGSLVGGRPRAGGPLADVDEDAPPHIEGVQAPMMSGRERRGVPPLRPIEIMTAVADAVDGGAPATYQDALNGLEIAGWKEAFATEAKSLDDNKVYTVVDKQSVKKVVKAKWVFRRKLLYKRGASKEVKGEMYWTGGDSKVKSIDLLTVSQSPNSLAENPAHHGRNKHIGWKWHFIRKQVELGMVKLVDVRTELMGVDMMLIGMSKCG